MRFRYEMPKYQYDWGSQKLLSEESIAQLSFSNPTDRREVLLRITNLGILSNSM